MLLPKYNGQPVYLDYMSSSPVNSEVILSIQAGLTQFNGNAAAVNHWAGRAAAEVISTSRQSIASVVGANAKDIIFTSGATESNYLAITGAVQQYQRQGRHIVCMATEHSSVIQACKHMQHQGYEVTWLKPDETGQVAIPALTAVLRSDTVLLSVMSVNNETGLINDVAQIAALAKRYGVLCHVDASQAVGRLKINVMDWDVDLMTLSSHKCGGPKGIGALYCRHHQPAIRLIPLMTGGSQERGLRPGTLATHQIMGMAKAYELAQENFALNREHIGLLSLRLESGLSTIPSFKKTLLPGTHVPDCVHGAFLDVLAEPILTAMPDFAFSMGSACNAVSAVLSPVLCAMGLSDQHIRCCFRVSIGIQTTEAEVDAFVNHLAEVVSWLRCLQPAFDRIDSGG